MNSTLKDREQRKYTGWTTIQKVPIASFYGANTPLGRAILSEKLDAISKLLMEGADSCKVDRNGKSPLFLAVQTKNLEVTKLLLEYGAEATIQTAFLESINANCTEITNYLLQKEVLINLIYRNGSTPLIKSIENHNFEIVKALVEKGADVNMADREGNLPLSVSLKKQNLHITKYLTKKGATINEKFIKEYLQKIEAEFEDIVVESRFLLLSKAVQTNNFVLVQYIVEQGVQLNQEGDNEKTSLIAAAAQNQNFRIIKCLIDAGADTTLAKEELEKFAHISEDFAIYLQQFEQNDVTDGSKNSGTTDN